MSYFGSFSCFWKDHGRFPCLVPAVFLLVVLGAEPIIDVIQSFFGIRKIRIGFIFFRCLFKAKRLRPYGSAKTFFLIVFLPFFYLITHPLKTCFQNSSFATKERAARGKVALKMARCYDKINSTPKALAKTRSVVGSEGNEYVGGGAKG